MKEKKKKNTFFLNSFAVRTHLNHRPRRKVVTRLGMEPDTPLERRCQSVVRTLIENVRPGWGHLDRRQSSLSTYGLRIRRISHANRLKKSRRVLGLGNKHGFKWPRFSVTRARYRSCMNEKGEYQMMNMFFLFFYKWIPAEIQGDKLDCECYTESFEIHTCVIKKSQIPN